MAAVLVILGAIVAFAGLVALVGLFAAVTLLSLWGWFAVPIFGLPPLTLAKAYAVALTLSFLTKTMNWEPGTDVYVKRTYFIWGPLMYMLFGWIAYQFIQAGY